MEIVRPRRRRQPRSAATIFRMARATRRARQRWSRHPIARRPRRRPRGKFALARITSLATDGECATVQIAMGSTCTIRRASSFTVSSLLKRRHTDESLGVPQSRLLDRESGIQRCRFFRSINHGSRITIQRSTIFKNLRRERISREKFEIVFKAIVVAVSGQNVNVRRRAWRRIVKLADHREPGIDQSNDSLAGRLNVSNAKSLRLAFCDFGFDGPNTDSYRHCAVNIGRDF
jgi:hypothetical protein